MTTENFSSRRSTGNNLIIKTKMKTKHSFAVRVFFFNFYKIECFKNKIKTIYMAKYIFVTGGVTSSLGKGIIAASLAKLLQARGFRVTIQKFDPYINVDPGTLKPL